jgi:hypothetical protein
MGRWLAATLLLVAALAAGVVAFLNGGGDPLQIRVTPTRAIALPLGTALGLAFAIGALVVAIVALAGAVARAVRRRLRARARARATAQLARDRVRAEALLVGGAADAARTRLADALGAHGPDERLLELLAGASEQSGDVAGAIAAIESARSRMPMSPLLAPAGVPLCERGTVGGRARGRGRARAHAAARRRGRGDGDALRAPLRSGARRRRSAARASPAGGARARASGVRAGLGRSGRPPARRWPDVPRATRL